MLLLPEVLYLLGKLYTPVESVFFNIFAQDNIKPELDGAFLKGKNSGKPFIIYFIVYLGKDGSKEKYKSFIGKLKKHWEYRGFPPEVVKIIDGGTREEFQIEHLILPKEYPPPIPKPDNPSEYCQTSTTN